MHKKYLFPFLLLPFSLTQAQTGAAASAVSERDFLGEVPIVLSVSRLAQPLDETPGAVTILDRQFIRMSGARDVADLLRLVPGFQTTTAFETDAPMATYHGRSNDWANRIQVLVDGRSVYSGYLQGSIGMGLQTLGLDDIERIEVLRGSNSAAYGARAFLGVINIVSRDVRETVGAAGSLTAGDNGVADVAARLGWGDESAMYRVSADTREDNGLRGAFGKNQVGRANFSTHLSPGGGNELDFRAGMLDIDAGRGTPGDAGNAARMRYQGSQFVQLDWRKTVADDQDVAVTLSHTENTYRDNFPYLSNTFGPLYYGTPIDFSGREFNDALTLQHTVRFSSALRTVWGAELRREQLVSRSSFDVRRQVSTDFHRVFGNAEWRLSPAVILNAGLMGEHSDIGGDSASPRVMLNWHVVDGHTLRAGVSRAFRPPSAFEKYGDVKYYDTNGANPLTFVASNGQVKSERVETRELGYYMNLPTVGLSGDLRLFDERISDGIVCLLVIPQNCVNKENYAITGAEYQITWKPGVDTLVFFNQTWTNIADATDFRTLHGAPKFAGSLTVMHTLASGIALSLMHQRTEEVALMSNDSGGVLNPLWSMGRTDVRIAKPFRVGKTRAELALTIQNLDMPYRDGDTKFFFDRRALVSLRFEQ